MNKKTTIYDIARELGITVSTVSRALNGITTISESTRMLVLQKAKELNYSANKLASSLASGRTQTIGVIVPNAQVNFFASVVHSIEREMKKNGYSVLLYQSNESFLDEINGINALLEAQVECIMMSMSLETEITSHLEKVISQNKPLILFDRTHDDLKVPSVVLDDFKAGYIVTRHLLDHGYTRIAFITTDKKIKIFNDRYAGYLHALAESGVDEMKNMLVRGILSIDAGRNAVFSILDNGLVPDAFIGGDDFTAVGIIQGLKERNYAIPETGVVGFSNQSFSSFITPSLSTVDQKANQMGVECAKLFLKMTKKSNPYENIEQIVLEPELIVRDSTNI